MSRRTPHCGGDVTTRDDHALTCHEPACDLRYVPADFDWSCVVRSYLLGNERAIPKSAAPHELTGPEMRDLFLRHLRGYVRYWASVKNPHASEGQSETEARLDGLAFSVLNMLDGTCVGLPAFDVVPNPHPTDRAYLIGKGENYWPPNKLRKGTKLLNDVLLHDLWHGVP